MRLTVEIEREADDRWLAEVPQLPGTLAYGATHDHARARSQALALRVLADRLEHGEAPADLDHIAFAAASGRGPAGSRRAARCFPAAPTGSDEGRKVSVHVRPVRPDDRDAWVAQRCDLWPDGHHEHADEVDAYFAGRAPEPAAVLVAVDGPRVVGFAELSLRACAEGCTTSPVAYLEGLYVVPDARRRGVARALVAAFEAWGREQGCREVASDTRADNQDSARMHLALGFEEAPPIRCFRKGLDPA